MTIMSVTNFHSPKQTISTLQRVQRYNECIAQINDAVISKKLYQVTFNIQTIHDSKLQRKFTCSFWKKDPFVGILYMKFYMLLRSDKNQHLSPEEAAPKKYSNLTTKRKNNVENVQIQHYKHQIIISDLISA